MITTAKIIGEGISYDTYSAQMDEHGDEVKRGNPNFIMSRSELAGFLLCPEKWLASSSEDEDTKATLFGRLAECIEMTPLEFDSLFIVHPENYPCDPTKKDPRTEKPWTRKANFCDEWEERHERDGLTVVSPKVFSEARAAYLAAEAYAPRAELVLVSKKQVMVVGEWLDKATQLVIPIRCLIDLVPPADHPQFGRWLCDSKTARNGDPNTWGHVTDDRGYDIQSAIILDLYAAATKEDRTEFVHLVQENTAPYHVVKPMPQLTAEFIEFGRAKYEIALREYAQCLATGRWPSYSTGNRSVINSGLCQLIGPESVWRYRESGGAVRSRIEHQPEPAREDRPDVPIP